MAESAEVGRLIVKISTDLSDLKKGMDDAKKQATGFSSQISTIFKGLAVGVLANEFRKLSAETLQWGQELNKVAQQTGLTATQVGSLKFAAERSNTSIEAVTANLRNLSRVMYEASQGNKEARQTFAQFQVEYQNADGTLRSASDVMSEVADRIKNTDNQTLKLAASQKLLGKNVQETLPFWNQGSDAIRKAGDEFKKILGQNVDLDKFAQQSDRLDAKWKDIQLKLKVLSVQVLDKLLPQFEKMMDILIGTDWTPFTNFISDFIDEIKREFDLIVKFVNLLKSAYDFMDKIRAFDFMNLAGTATMGLAASPLGQAAQNQFMMPEVEVTAERNGTGGGPGDGFGSSESEDASLAGKDIQNEIGEVSTALDELAKKWANVNKEIQDSLAATLQAIATGFGTAIADVIVEGKDFGEAMKELWKDIAKTIIAEIVRIIAQLMILFVWQQMTGQTGGGARGIGRLLGFRDGGAIGPAVHARDGLITGPFGEAGIPAVVHPNEIISPIDKFFDFVKDTARSAQTNITVNAGDRDPREIAYAVQLEIDRRQRGV